MRVGFTGTRLGMSDHQKEQFVLELQKYDFFEFHHGDCEGADAEAHEIVRLLFPECRIIVHPPTIADKRAFMEGDEHREPKPYIPRDKNIVNETNFLIGAPMIDEEQIRSGTWTTIRHARRTNKPHTILKR